jgi:predicted SnoaL-like aldol condensation-catalyzing enzyme
MQSVSGLPTTPSTARTSDQGVTASFRSSRRPDTLHWEYGAVVAEGDHVFVHSKFTGNGLPRAWIAVDIVRMENGILTEHWDVIQDEATAEESQSGALMFGSTFSPG